MNGAEQAVVDVALVEGPVEPAPCDDADPACGAECVFLGRTRAEVHPRHGSLASLDYEAYPELAIAEMTRIAREVAAAHGCRRIEIRHATGRVPLGAASVRIRVLAGHRDGAFAACRATIDRVKASVPIWKRERWADGSTWQAGRPVKVIS